MLTVPGGSLTKADDAVDAARPVAPVNHCGGGVM